MSIAELVSPTPSSRLRGYCRAARWALLLGMGLVALEVGYFFLVPLATWDLTGSGWLSRVKWWMGTGTRIDGLQLVHSQLWVIGVIDLLPYLLLLFGLVQLWLYFGAAAQGGAFDRPALRHVWRFALAFCGMSVTQLTRQTLAWHVLTLGVADAAPRFGPTVAITGEQLLVVLLSVGVFGVAAVLSEAARMADEMREFV
jgi:hypothetical protein